MAGGAGFGVVGMLIEEGTGLFGVAAATGFSFGHSLQLVRVLGAMGVVAVSAVDFTFFNRMMAGQGELGSLIDMTFHTGFRGFPRCQD